ncbi:choline dehydrogenase 4 [Marasmius sp. AFHP31]|nr:choline dehydrogenase 4 [Marasmius sp. AFHP31]
MPRTRQTAQKSTGAPAPTKSLKVAAVGTVKTASKRAQNALETPRGKSKKSWSGARLEHLDGILGFEARFRLESGVDIYIDQKFIDKNENPLSHIEYCGVCRNGGDLICCDSCPGTVCKECLGKDVAGQYLNGGYFRCPRCHLDNNALQKYTGFSLRKEALILQPRGTYRHATAGYNSNPILVLNIYLNDGLVKPGLVTSAALPIKDWTAGDLALIQVPYNFASPDEDIPTHIQIMNDIAHHLSDGLLRRVTKIALFISTHTDPVNGTFHSEIGNGGAVDFKELTEFLCPDALRVQFRARGGSSHLFLLACGGFWLNKGVRDEVFDFVQDIAFDHVLGFSGRDLQPLFTAPFLRHSMEMFLIHGKELYTRSVLPEHSVLGSHTGVVWMRPSKNGRSTEKERYVWHHPVYSPFGFPENLPQQCPDCGILKPWTGVDSRVRNGEHKVTLHCQSCGKEKTIKRGEGWRKITGGGENAPYNKSATGDWLVEKLG